MAVVFALSMASACEPGDAARPPQRAPTSSASTRLRRLSPRELRTAIADLTSVELPESVLPDRADAVGYDNGPVLLDFSYDDTSRLIEAAEWAVREASRRRSTWIGSDCPKNVVPGCRASALAFAEKAYRRVLSPDEIQSLGATFDARTSTGESASVAADNVALTALVSPGFLYREELGSVVNDGARRLAPREIAESLAFFLTGGAPDEALVLASRDDSLADADVRRREATRLAQSPRGRATLRAFLEQWLHASQIAHLAKDPKRYPENGPALTAEMRRDLALTLELELAHEGSLTSLLTTRVAFPGKLLGSIYGVAVAEPFTKVELDPATRAGVLTRVGLLSVHSASDGSGPIARGLAVRAGFLCASLPSPPPGTPRVVPAAEARTTRDRFAQHSSDLRCQGCHERIDGVGFGFEAYDGIGRHREQEAGFPIDDSGHLFDADVADGPFRGVPELERKLLTSTALRACFVTHALRYAFGSGESRSDEPLLRELTSRFSVEAPLHSLFVDIAAHEAFVRRTSP